MRYSNIRFGVKGFERFKSVMVDWFQVSNEMRFKLVQFSNKVRHKFNHRVLFVDTERDFQQAVQILLRFSVTLLRTFYTFQFFRSFSFDTIGSLQHHNTFVIGDFGFTHGGQLFLLLYHFIVRHFECFLDGPVQWIIQLLSTVVGFFRNDVIEDVSHVTVFIIGQQKQGNYFALFLLVGEHKSHHQGRHGFLLILFQHIIIIIHHVWQFCICIDDEIPQGYLLNVIIDKLARQSRFNHFRH